MSWSIMLIGKPENIVEALEKESDNFTGQSKIEYDDAKPHLIGLAKQNFGRGDSYVSPVIKMQASGSGYATTANEQKQRSCSVIVEPMWGKLV
jgi:hypothetical protein